MSTADLPTAELSTVELSGGPIDYLDTAKDGSGDRDRPTIVFGHGLVMDQTLWTGVTDRLAEHARCLVPVLPLGGHRRPMHPDADLSLHGQADLLGEFIAHLDLEDVVLVSVDWGGPQLTAVRHPERLAGLVLLPQEAFDNIPPGLPGRFAAFAGRMPGGLFMAAQTLRVGFLSRLPITLGPMAKRPIPADVRNSWVHGLRTSRGVRRDTRRYITTSDNSGLNEAAELLADFEPPTLVLWGSEETLMPIEHGRRLAEIIPNARYAEIDDCFTLMPLDRPDAVAEHLLDFIREMPSGG